VSPSTTRSAWPRVRAAACAALIAVATVLLASACTRDRPAVRPASGPAATRLSPLEPARRAVRPAPAPARPPSATARYRTGVPEDRAIRVPADLKRGMASDPARFLAPLVAHLVQGQPDDLGRAKALHDWIALNLRYDVEGYFGGAHGGGGWEDALRSGKSVCEGYASLFEAMCAAAGLACATVGGYARGYGYDASSGREDSGKGNHAWSAVQAGGQWYLLDPTWDAGHLDGRRFVAEYGTDYLFLEPRDFLHTHLPDDPTWQLLAHPVSRDEFDRLPYLRGNFFASGLALRTPVDRVTDAAGSAALELDAPEGTTVLATLRAPRGPALAERTFTQRDGPVTRVLARFPASGDYVLQLFALPAGETSGREVARLAFRNRGGSAEGFPKAFSTFHDRDCTLLSPLSSPLRAGDVVHFAIRVPDARSVRIHDAADRWTPLEPSAADGGVFEADVAVPGGAFQILVDDGAGGQRYLSLLEFQG
jgi:transglutaminase-like putative cysteine protease